MYWDLAHKAPRIQDDFISMYYSARGGYGPDAYQVNIQLKL